MRAGKPVLSRPLEDVFEEHAKASLENSWGAWLGTIFTGLALVFTFILIALVLFRDVGPAIRAVSAEGAQVGAGAHAAGGESGSGSGEILANAVATLGAKFLISCLGIFLTIIHQAVFRAIRSKAVATAGAAAAELAGNWESMDACSVRTQSELLERLGTLEQAVRSEAKVGRESLSAEMVGLREEMRTGVAAMKQALGRLEQITVSVQDLGSEVSVKLADMMKQTIAEEVARRLTEVKQAIDSIEEKLGAFITQNAEQLSKDLRASLEQIHLVLVNQSSSEVGKLLEHLKDAVSGGFSSETENMSKMLLGFSEVLPTMSSQMQSVAGELRKVVEDLREQQSKTNELVDGIARSSNKHIEEMGASLARNGGEALTQVLGVSKDHISKIVASLQSAAESHAAKTTSMAESIEQAGGSVTQVTAALGGASEKLAATAKEASALITSTAQSTRAMVDVAAALQRTTEQAGGLLKQVSQGQEQAKGVLAQLATESQRQSELLQKMQTTWPILIRQVTESVQQSTDKLGTSWSVLADKLNTATQNYGTHVGEKVEELTEAVETLTKTVPNLRK
jgi:ABC-type transporter Mla subunit MlaD